MASLVFTAFMIEAYLNHVGPRIFKCWEDVERLSPSSKLNLIVEKLGIEKGEGKRPYQTLPELFEFRNKLAHGKSIKLKSDNEVRIVDPSTDEYMNERLETEWEKYCTLENAKRALKDMESIIIEIHNHAGITDERPFSFGMQGTGATLLPEEQVNDNTKMSN